MEGGWVSTYGSLKTNTMMYDGSEPMTVKHYRYPRITFDPNRCFGKACIRDLRMPVASVLSHLASGMSQAEILKEWPELEPEDLHQALAYAAETTDDRVIFSEDASISA